MLVASVFARCGLRALLGAGAAAAFLILLILGLGTPPSLAQEPAAKPTAPDAGAADAAKKKTAPEKKAAAAPASPPFAPTGSP